MLDDVFKARWAKTYLNYEFGMISIDTNGDFYWVKEAFGLDLTDKKIKILSKNLLYSDDTGMYYGYDNYNNIVGNRKKFKKAVSAVIEVQDAIIGISEDNQLVINKTSLLDDYYVDWIYQELHGLTFSDIKIAKDNSGVLLITTEGKKYIITNYNIINVEEEFPMLNGVNINELITIDDNIPKIVAITEEGKLIVATKETINILDFNEKIIEVSLEGGIIKSESGNYYWLTNEGNKVVVAGKLEDRYTELKGKHITKLVYLNNMEIVLTDDKNAFLIQGENIANIKDYIENLKDKNIKDAIVDVDENIEEKIYILTDDGELYSEDNKLIATDIDSVREGYNCGIVKNKNGYEGYFNEEENIVYPNIDNVEHKLNINFTNVNKIANDYILLENGDLYKINVDEEQEELNVNKIDNTNFNGRKIIYIGDSDMLIDENYNIWSENYDGTFENITDDYAELKGKNIVQIEYNFAISEDGKIYITNPEISDEEKAKLENKKIIKIHEDRILDSEGIVYEFDENIIRQMDELNGIKIKDFCGNAFLDDKGKLYNSYYNYENDSLEIKCISENEDSEIYNKKIVNFSALRGVVSCIDDAGNRYLLGRMVQLG